MENYKYGPEAVKEHGEFQEEETAQNLQKNQAEESARQEKFKGIKEGASVSYKASPTSELEQNLVVVKKDETTGTLTLGKSLNENTEYGTAVSVANIDRIVDYLNPKKPQ